MPDGVVRDSDPISENEAAVLFHPLSISYPPEPALVLAVSGGPDSVALMWLAARWRDRLENKPRLIAITVDHGLRKESAREALAAWPDRTITIIVIFAPGGSNDLLGRLIAAELAPALRQNVIVENRVGANGNIGLTAGARAAPDGYTLVVASGVVLINPSVSKVA